MQRNIAVDPDVWLKLKSEAIRRNRNLREFAGDIITDYVKGLEKGESKMPKAIIIGAGMGSRLLDLTKDQPECMLKIKGKTILERNMETLNRCGIDDIIFIKGYKKDMINYSNLKYYYNDDYENNNILESLFYAESEMDDEFIVIYSDILFDKEVVSRVLNNNNDITIVMDSDWRTHYKGRVHHPIEEAEKVIVENGKVTKIAKYMNPVDASGEFIGMAKFSKEGAVILKSTYMAAKKQYKNQPFHNAETIKKAYLTDMFQELIDRGYDVYATEITGKWQEIDTIEDFRKAGGEVSDYVKLT